MKKIKETRVYKFLFRSDGLFSACATAAFALYNAWLGVTERYYFALSIAAYYFLLFLAGILLYFRIKKESAGKEGERRAEKTNGETEFVAAQDADSGISEKKRCVFISALLFVVNFLLIGPVALMALNRRNFTLGMIPAISFAAYSVYKIARAIINYRKTRKGESDAKRIRHALRLIDALVSVLTLQNTLLIATGGAQQTDMRLLTVISSAAIYALVVAISFVTFFRTVKKR